MSVAIVMSSKETLAIFHWNALILEHDQTVGLINNILSSNITQFNKMKVKNASVAYDLFGFHSQLCDLTGIN
jgi:hypothetical protein